MSAARIRSALTPSLKNLGFARRGQEFVLRQAELEHVLSVFAVRRLAGYFEVIQGVFEPDGSSTRGAKRPALVQERIRSFSKPYLDAWDSSRFDPALALRQVSAVVKAFGSLADIAHFLSDRPESDSTSILPASASTSPPNSLSQEQEKSALRHHSNLILADHFVPAPRLGEEMWAHRQEVGGYRYCVYLRANETATFATVMYFGFASRDIEKGRKSAEVVRLLYGAPKHLLRDLGEPILFPLVTESVDHGLVTEILLNVLAVTPPNSLPRSEA